MLLLRQGQDAVPPRILLVALAADTAPGFAVDAINARLVPADPSGQIEDPLANGGIVVRPGGFDVTLTAFAGSADSATLRYRFRWQPGCSRLVEFRRADTNRASLDTRDLTVNLLTGDVRSSTGNERTGAVRSRVTRLANNPRRCLADLPNGLTFDPVAGR